jgi:hypothetical protein
MNKKGMKKMTLYKKGGKLYYKKGGKMCLYKGGGPVRYRKKNTLPKYQGDLYSTSEIQPITTTQIDNPYTTDVLDSTIDPIEAPEQKTKNNKNAAATGMAIANIGAQFLKNMYDSEKQKSFRNQKDENPYYSKMGLGQESDSAEGVAGAYDAGVGVVSSINPIIGTAVGIGRMGSDMIRDEDKYGIAAGTTETMSPNAYWANQLSPSKKHQSGIETGAKYGAGYGALEFITGIPFGDMFAKKAQNQADALWKEDESRRGMFDGSRTGTTKSGIYARYGKEITTPRNVLNDNWNAEIENGEIVIDTSGKNIPNIRYGGTNTYASLQSPYAVKFTGDKHGEDSNKDGQEGIPIKAAEGLYVASNYLGLDGKKAKKGQKTVAQEMQPIVESLSNADTNSMDAYKNNDEFINHQLKQLEEMKNDAEAAKVAEELKKLLSKKDRDMGEIAAFIQQNADYLLNDPNAQQQNLPKMEEGNPDMQVAKDGVIIDKDDTTVNEDGDITVTKSTPQKNIIGAQNRMPVSEQTGMPTDLSAKLVTSEGGKYGDVFTPQGSLTSKMQNKLVSDYGMSSDDASKVTAYNLQNYKPIGKLISDYYGVRSGNQTLRSADPNVRGDAGLNKIQNQGQWAQGIINDIVANEGILPSKYVDLPASVKNEMLRISRLPGNNKNISQGKFTSELKNAYNKAVLSNTREIDRIPSSALKLNEMKPEFSTRGEAFNYYRKLGKPEFEWEGKRYTTKTRSEMGLDPLTQPIVYKTKTTPNVNYLGDKSNITNIPINKKGGMTKNKNMNYNRNLIRKLLRKQNGGPLPTYQGNKMHSVATLTALKNRANDPNATPEQRAKSRYALSVALGQNRSLMPGDVTPIDFKPSEFGGVDPITKYAPTLYTQPDGTLGTTPPVKTVAPQLKNMQRISTTTEKDLRPSGEIFTGEKLKNVPSRDDYFGTKRKPLQQGGPIPGQEQEQPNESNEHLQKLIGEQMQQDPNANMQPGMEEQMAAEQQMAEQEGEMDAQQGMVPPVLANIDPQLQQVFMQLPPEVQEQILNLPPEQIEIALMNVMEQMMGGQGAEQQMAAEQQMMEQSQVPPGVMDQLS